MLIKDFTDYLHIITEEDFKILYSILHNLTLQEVYDIYTCTII